MTQHQTPTATPPRRHRPDLSDSDDQTQESSTHDKNDTVQDSANIGSVTELAFLTQTGITGDHALGAGQPGDGDQ